MTGSGDAVDTEVQVFDGTKPMGTVPLTSTLTGAPFDESGTASIPNTLPNDGKLHLVRIVGETTGPTSGARRRRAEVAVQRPRGRQAGQGRGRPHQGPGDRHVKSGGEPVNGRVQVKVNGKTYKATLVNGRAVVHLPKFQKTGKKTVRVTYAGNATTAADSAKATFRVVKK